MVTNAQGSNRFVDSIDELDSGCGYNGDLAFVMDRSQNPPKITAMYVKNGTWISVFGSSEDSSVGNTDESTDNDNENTGVDTETP